MFPKVHFRDQVSERFFCCRCINTAENFRKYMLIIVSSVKLVKKIVSETLFRNFISEIGACYAIKISFGNELSETFSGVYSQTCYIFLFKYLLIPICSERVVCCMCVVKIYPDWGTKAGHGNWQSC